MTAVALRTWAPLGVAALQGTFALILVALLAWARILPRPSMAAVSRYGLLRLGVLLLLGGVGFIACMNIAVKLAGPTITGFVATLYAVFAALLAVPVLHERLRPGTIGAFVLALLGTLLLAGFQPLDADATGIAFGLGAAVCFGLYMVLSRRWTATANLDGTSITMANLVGRGPVLLMVQLLIDPAGLFPGTVEPASLVALAGLVLLPSLMSQVLLIASVKRVPARRTSASLLLTPLTAAAVSAIFLDERPTPMELVGGLLVVVGIAGASGALGALAHRFRGPSREAPRSA
jgi:drug/metabolite transporter (DMT)-like permease